MGWDNLIYSPTVQNRDLYYSKSIDTNSKIWHFFLLHCNYKPKIFIWKNFIRPTVGKLAYTLHLATKKMVSLIPNPHKLI